MATNFLNWQESEDAGLFLDAIQVTRFPLLVCFAGEDSPSQCVEFDERDYTILKEVLVSSSGIGEIRLRNMMRITDYKPAEEADVETYITVYATDAESFRVFDNIKYGINRLEYKLDSHLGSSLKVQAEEMLKFLKLLSERNGESLYYNIENVDGIEIMPDIREYEDFGHWYAEEYLDYHTVFTLEDYVDWFEFGRDYIDDTSEGEFILDEDYGLIVL